MKQPIITLCLLLTLVTLACKNEVKTTTEQVIKVVSPEEMQNLLKLDNVQFVDVRTPEEHKEGYIPNSQNIDFNSPTFNEDILKLDKEKPVILYCRSGGRSAKSAKILKDAGFKEIYDLEGGITKWKDEGLEIKIE